MEAGKLTKNFGTMTKDQIFPQLIFLQYLIWQFPTDFLDIVMLGMDGFAVMRELQKNPATKDIPVVFVSSKSQKADQAWAKMQGAKGFVPKPINEQAILEEIRKF